MATKDNSETPNLRLFGDICVYHEEKNKSECILVKNDKKCGKHING